MVSRAASSPFLANVGLHVLLGFLHHLFDARGMDAAIGDQLRQRQFGHFATDRVEARKQHRLRGVIDDQVDARQALEGPDVAAFPAR